MPHILYNRSYPQVEILGVAQKSLGILVGQHIHQVPRDPPQEDSRGAGIQADLELLLPKSQERHRPPPPLCCPLETHELDGEAHGEDRLHLNVPQNRTPHRGTRARVPFLGIRGKCDPNRHIVRTLVQPGRTALGRVFWPKQRSTLASRAISIPPSWTAPDLVVEGSTQWTPLPRLWHVSRQHKSAPE